MAGSGGVSGSRWRDLRGIVLQRIVLCAFLVPLLCSEASGIVNPHDTTKPKYCLNCHTEEIYTQNCEDDAGYCLLGGSVDGICLTCHLKEDCCRPGREHLPSIYLGLKSHPTDVEVRDLPSAYYPKTLPIHRGRITCRTCHRHARERSGGYKMLRLVKITDRGVDWSVLCQDCHKDR